MWALRLRNVGYCTLYSDSILDIFLLNFGPLGLLGTSKLLSRRLHYHDLIITNQH